MGGRRLGRRGWGSGLFCRRRFLARGLEKEVGEYCEEVVIEIEGFKCELEAAGGDDGKAE